ncbi:MAG: hypothetical protein AB1295_02985 [Candidatus Micrarchaeota archaeon]
MRDVLKPPSNPTSPRLGEPTNRSRTSLLEGLQIGERMKVDADILLCRLAGESESVRAGIFQEFESIARDGSSRRDVAMDLIIALREGNPDAALALGHMKAKEGIADLREIARREDGSAIYRNAIRAMCMFECRYEFLDEISRAFLEQEGLEAETAKALADMNGIGLGLLETVVLDRKTAGKPKILAALNAIGDAGPSAKAVLKTLEITLNEGIGLDRDIRTALEDAIKKVNG